MTCTFFGHGDTPSFIEPVLRTTLIDLIENKHVNLFYVGNQGSFDYIAHKTLKQLKSNYPHIRYAVVLAYLPIKSAGFDYTEYSETIYPDGFENIPPRYAIANRNRWMINHSDYVVAYVKHTVGGAAKFKELAERQGKTVLNLANSGGMAYWTPSLPSE